MKDVHRKNIFMAAVVTQASIIAPGSGMLVGAFMAELLDEGASEYNDGIRYPDIGVLLKDFFKQMVDAVATIIKEQFLLENIRQMEADLKDIGSNLAYFDKAKSRFFLDLATEKVGNLISTITVKNAIPYYLSQEIYLAAVAFQITIFLTRHDFLEEDTLDIVIDQIGKAIQHLYAVRRSWIEWSNDRFSLLLVHGGWVNRSDFIGMSEKVEKEHNDNIRACEIGAVVYYFTFDGSKIFADQVVVGIDFYSEELGVASHAREIFMEKEAKKICSERWCTAKSAIEELEILREKLEKLKPLPLPLQHYAHNLSLPAVYSFCMQVHNGQFWQVTEHGEVLANGSRGSPNTVFKLVKVGGLGWFAFCSFAGYFLTVSQGHVTAAATDAGVYESFELLTIGENDEEDTFEPGDGFCHVKRAWGFRPRLFNARDGGGGHLDLVDDTRATTKFHMMSP